MSTLRNTSVCFLFAVVPVLVNHLSAQEKTSWIDIFLTDTVGYADFSVDRVTNDSYPPASLFDADLRTTWVNSTVSGDRVPLYVQLPSPEDPVIHIFPGYGKSEPLFRANARPRKIKLSLYAAIQPDGHVTEYGALYKAVRFPYEQLVELRDSFSIQKMEPDFKPDDLNGFAAKVRQQFETDFPFPVAGSCFILKMEILDVYFGTKYDDICISEIFFNDCLVAFQPGPKSATSDIYLNEDQNTLLADDAQHTGAIVFYDSTSVLQLIETDKNMRWAILLSVPAVIGGRAETTYLLVDIRNKKVVNEQLVNMTGDYIRGQPMYFETGENGILHLHYTDTSGQFSRIMLR